MSDESPMLGPLLKPKLDYDDYCAIPPDGRRWEIIDGDPYVTPAPNIRHQRVSRRLQRQLEDYFEGRSRVEVFNAPTDVILGRHDIFQPDLVLAEPGAITERAIEAPPLLAIEILSPSSRRQDRGVKPRRYAELGVPHYWLVDPVKRRIECFRVSGRAYRKVCEVRGNGPFAHPEWPDLKLDLAALWRGSSLKATRRTRP